MKEIVVSQENLIVAMNCAITEKNKNLPELMDLFLDMNSINEEGNIVINNNSIANYILIKNNIENECELVSINDLALSLARSIYEYNHEMRKSLQKYYRMMIDAMINNNDIEIVSEIIMNDQKVIDYIKKYETLDDYIVKLKGKKKSKER